MNRPSWDCYFMAIARLTAMRSHDRDTKHGAVLVDHRNRIIATGYNGYPHGGGEAEYPDSRPDKYLYMLHAELNALLHRSPYRVPAKLYCTGFPCAACFLAIVQCGISEVIFGDQQSEMIDQRHQSAVEQMAKVHDVRLRSMELDDVKALIKSLGG